MTNGSLVTALYALAKRAALNHQERELIRTAAKLIAIQDGQLHELSTALERAAQTEIPMVTAGAAADGFRND